MQDFIVDENYDLVIKNGDFAIGDSNSQEIDLLVRSFKGDWKQYPLLGAELLRLVKGRATEVRIKRDITEELKNDGFNIIKIKVDLPIVEVDAKR